MPRESIGINSFGAIFPGIALSMGALLWAPAVHAQAAANADEVRALKAEMQALQQTLARMQARLDALETPKATAAARTELAAAQPATERETVGDELTGVARPDTAPPPNNPALRGFIEIPGTQTSVKLGGFAKVNAIYDFAPAGNTDKLVPPTIPTDGRGGRNFNVDANATRFSLDVRRPSVLGPLRFYLENDFYGGAGVTAFRLRQAHGQVGNTYGGYGYSAFSDSDAFPETLDDEGPGGEALLRVASLRQMFKLGSGLTATLSVEDPASNIALPAGATATQPAPDVVGALKAEGRWGHVQAAAVARRIGYTSVDGSASSFGYGLNLSALGHVGGDFVMASFTYGDGIARYFNDLGGRVYDGVIDADGNVRTLKSWGGFLGYTRHWSARWRSNLVGSFVKLERDELLQPTAFRASHYGAANLIFQASPNFSLGFETLYGRNTLQNGDWADVVRLQTSLKYDLVR